MDLSASATLKLILLLASGISHQIVMTPPNPPAKKIVRPTFFEKNIHALIKIALVSRALFIPLQQHSEFIHLHQYPFWLAVLLDIAATVMTASSSGGLSSAFSDVVSILVPRRVDAQALQRPSASFVLGALLLVVSASLRMWCYKTLGNQFRFEVSIQTQHKLITSGPYSFVRHPSYLAFYGYIIGSAMLFTSPGSYALECVLWPLPHAVLCTMSFEPNGCDAAAAGVGKFHVAALVVLATWFAGIVFLERNVVGRLSWEDDVLHKEFGKEWETYADRVRWRILPGVL